MATRTQLNTIPLRKITDFKSKLSGGGTRSNLFEVELAFPAAIGVDSNTLDKSRFLVKAAALPASNVSPVEVAFRGRTLKLAGDRTFETWTITVINDTDFAIRSAFEKWSNYMNRLSDNIISWACDDFLTVEENLSLGEDYDEIYSFIYDYIKELFGFELLELYRDTCEEED